MNIDSLSADPFLIDYAAGAMVRATKPIQTLLAPIVPVGSIVGHYKRYTRDHRLTLPNTTRVIDGRAIQLEVAAEDERFQCQINAIDAPLDTVSGEDLKWLVPDALDLLAEVESQVIEHNTIAKAVEGAGAGAAMLWDAAADPVKLIDAELLALAKKSRSDSLGVAFGPLAWGLFKNHPKVIARGAASIAWASHPNLFHTGARFETCYSLYDTAPLGAEEVIDFMFPANAVLLVSRSERPTRRSPDFMKTFRARNRALGLRITQRADGRVVYVQNDWAVDLKVTNDEGVARFNISES